MKHQDTRRKLLIWALVLLLLPLLFQHAEARAAHDELLTGLIDGKAFRFSLDALQSRTACLLVYQDGKRSDLLQFRHREKVYTASLTKIMTAYLAYELMEAKGRTLDDRVPVRAVDLDGLQTLNASVAGFQDGESVSFRDLFYGLLIGSGCDAANTLARVAAGSADEFLLLMNEKAKTLGLSDSSYANPTGLFDAGNYGTAEDVAVLLARTLENPFLHEVLMRP